MITPGVEKLRDDFGLPGMKVLQFAWSDPANPFLPHNHPVNCIVYTGTHDNNTTRGWWENEVDEPTRAFVNDYLGHDVHDIVWTMARVGMRSAGRVFIMPMQDVLGLGRRRAHEYAGQKGRQLDLAHSEDGARIIRAKTRCCISRVCISAIPTSSRNGSATQALSSGFRIRLRLELSRFSRSFEESWKCAEFAPTMLKC